jgi:hypothetical protein
MRNLTVMSYRREERNKGKNKEGVLSVFKKYSEYKDKKIINDNSMKCR